jgi:hypothetical protein
MDPDPRVAAARACAPGGYRKAETSHRAIVCADSVAVAIDAGRGRVLSALDAEVVVEVAVERFVEFALGGE